MKASLAIPSLVLFVSCFAPVPADAPAERLRNAENAIQGDWACVRLVSKDYNFDHDLSQEKPPSRTVGFKDGRMTCVIRNDAGEIVNKTECEYSLQICAHGLQLLRTKVKEIEGRDFKPLNFIAAVDKEQLTLKLYAEKGLRGDFIDPAKYSAKQLRENYNESFWHYKRR